jgi:cytochrome c biogenesis protein CcmG, thiol:disulfide interchange protein DsbE
MTDGTNADRRPHRPTLLLLLPLAVFLVLAALFFLRLGSGDPGQLPSALIGHTAPATSLPPIPGLERDGKPLPGLESTAFEGEVTLVNVWASWCIPCHEEVPFLQQLGQDSRIHLVGLNYKDAPENARRFLGRYGNPFLATGADQNGRGAIEWGVYGVPETFLVGRDTRIAFKLVGPITEANFDAVLKPEIDKAVAATAPR